VEVLQSVERAITHHSAVLDLKHAPEVVLSRIATLNPRERQVFELIVRGKSNKAVAQVLCSTARTIKAHRLRVMEKMQVRSIVELVSLAEQVRIGMQSADLSMPVG
jgi:FixJ family two-component response regulator